jgi:hypothetical protein
MAEKTAGFTGCGKTLKIGLPAQEGAIDPKKSSG